MENIFTGLRSLFVKESDTLETFIISTSTEAKLGIYLCILTLVNKACISLCGISNVIVMAIFVASFMVGLGLVISPCYRTFIVSTCPSFFNEEFARKDLTSAAYKCGFKMVIGLLLVACPIEYVLTNLTISDYVQSAIPIVLAMFNIVCLVFIRAASNRVNSTEDNEDKSLSQGE